MFSASIWSKEKRKDVLDHFKWNFIFFDIISILIFFRNTIYGLEIYPAYIYKWWVIQRATEKCWTNMRCTRWDVLEQDPHTIQNGYPGNAGVWLYHVFKICKLGRAIFQIQEYEILYHFPKFYCKSEIPPMLRNLQQNIASIETHLKSQSTTIANLRNENALLAGIKDLEQELSTPMTLETTSSGTTTSQLIT